MSFQEKYLSIFEVVKDDVEKVKSSLFDGIELDNSLKFKLFDILNAPSKHIRAVLTFLYLKTAGMKIDEKQIFEAIFSFNTCCNNGNSVKFIVDACGRLVVAESNRS